MNTDVVDEAAVKLKETQPAIWAYSPLADCASELSLDEDFTARNRRFSCTPKREPTPGWVQDDAAV